MKTAASKSTSNAPRARSREKTAAALQLALERLSTTGGKLSIAAVAKEVGVSAALIHNKYAGLAEEIRKRVGKAARDQRDDKHRQLASARETIRDLRQQNGELLHEVRVLASKNEGLRRQLAEALAVATSRNVTPIRRKPK